MLATEWCESNYMKLNQDKCHFSLYGHKHEVMFAKIEHSKIWESCAQKHLGIIIDRNLKFDKYILTRCKRPGRKHEALARVCMYLSFEHKRTLMKAFIEPQCVFCPLIYMLFAKNLQILELIIYMKELLESSIATMNQHLKIFQRKITLYPSTIKIFVC